MLSPVPGTGWVSCNSTRWALPSWKGALLKRICEKTIWTCILSVLLQQWNLLHPGLRRSLIEQDMHKHTGLSLVEDHRTAKGLQQEVLKDLGRSVLGQGGYRALTAVCKHVIGRLKQHKASLLLEIIRDKKTLQQEKIVTISTTCGRQILE